MYQFWREVGGQFGKNMRWAWLKKSSLKLAIRRSKTFIASTRLTIQGKMIAAACETAWHIISESEILVQGEYRRSLITLPE